MPCSLGLSRLLRERLAEGDLTFYYVRPIYITPLSFHISQWISSCRAWIGSIQVRVLVRLSGPWNRNSQLYQFALIFFPALISGRLFDLGYLHSTLIFASIILVACTFSIAECHAFWPLLLFQGMGIGVSIRIPHL